jgi:hypothetical protein
VARPGRRRHRSSEAFCATDAWLAALLAPGPEGRSPQVAWSTREEGRILFPLPLFLSFTLPGQCPRHRYQARGSRLTETEWKGLSGLSCPAFMPNRVTQAGRGTPSPIPARDCLPLHVLPHLGRPAGAAVGNLRRFHDSYVQGTALAVRPPDFIEESGARDTFMVPGRAVRGHDRQRTTE